jgi:cell division protein FtsZ
MNTDVQDLRRSAAPVRVQLGVSVVRGLGAGGDPEVGRDCARADAMVIGEALAGASDVALLVGLGGGTGSGAAGSICEIARGLGARVRAVVTLPLAFEGRRRARVAATALAELREALGEDCIVVSLGEPASTGGPPPTMAEQFARLDGAMAEGLAALPV